MVMSVAHQYKSCWDEKSNQKAFNSNKEVIICVGSTGTGKSSLIKLFCGNNVVVGHGTQSKTTKSSLFKASGNKYWLDSQGANDSAGTDDEKVLTDVLKKLYNEKITKIKVVWCVSGDMCRAKAEFQRQAAFIKSLGNNVWRSCLIIKKQGRPHPKKMNGVIDSANKYGAKMNENDADRLFGFRGLEYGGKSNEEDEVLSLLNEEKDLRKRKIKYKKHGYFNNKQIIKETTKKLSKLPSLKISFVTKKCIKCGVKGDPRFVYGPCHTQLEKYHSGATVPYHPGRIKKYHNGSVRTQHTGSISTSYSYEWYHPGNYDDEVLQDVLEGIATRGIAPIVKAIKGHKSGKWTCCGEHESSGCERRQSGANSTWSCCGKSSWSSGCTSEYGCCGGSTYSAGCIKEWDCCGASSNNSGCKWKYECCGNYFGSVGCKSRCRSCHNAWGKSAGCTNTTNRLYKA